jgi:hypothetical protein
VAVAAHGRRNEDEEMASDNTRAALLLAGLLGTTGARACRTVAHHGDDIVRAATHVDDIPTPRVSAPASEIPSVPTRAPEVAESIPASSEVEDSARHVLETVQHGADAVTELIDDDE